MNLTGTYTSGSGLSKKDREFINKAINAAISRVNADLGEIEGRTDNID